MAAPTSGLRPLGCRLLLLLLATPISVASVSHRHPKSKANLLDPEVACGQPVFQGKIFGGYTVLSPKWPWQVSIHYAGHHVCGGSILSAYWVLSAAHCFGREKRIDGYDIYVGLINLFKANKYTQWFEVNQVIIHPSFGVLHPVGGDVALVQLKSPIIFSDFVLPICLPPHNLMFKNLSCWATGWGMISMEGMSPQDLQEAQLPLVPQNLCRFLYGPYSPLLPEMICAMDLRNVKNVCEGDSGGPLVCKVNQTWLQIGIVSWGRGCARPLYPGVFVNVLYFSRWISYNMEVKLPPPQIFPDLSLSSSLRATPSIFVTVLASLLM